MGQARHLDFERDRDVSLHLLGELTGVLRNNADEGRDWSG
jgi:hypothetical protein